MKTIAKATLFLCQLDDSDHTIDANDIHVKRSPSDGFPHRTGNHPRRGEGEQVFTEEASASSTTRARVNGFATELGYRPNPLARALVGQRTKLVALAVGQTRSVFDLLFLKTLADGLTWHRKHLLIF